MNRASLINVVVALTLISVLGWQSWTLTRVNARLAVVEQILAIEQAPSKQAGLDQLQRAFGQDGAALAGAGQSAEALQIKQALEGTEGAADPATQNAIANMVEQTLDRKAAEKKNLEVNRWFANATEHHQDLLEQVGETHDLSEDTLADALDIFIGAWERGAEIKEEVHEGTMNWADAKAEGETLREETGGKVTEVIGEAAAEDLWALMFDQKSD
jgi:hypothetical protein